MGMLVETKVLASFPPQRPHGTITGWNNGRARFPFLHAVAPADPAGRVAAFPPRRADEPGAMAPVRRCVPFFFRHPAEQRAQEKTRFPPEGRGDGIKRPFPLLVRRGKRNKTSAWTGGTAKEGPPFVFGESLWG